MGASAPKKGQNKLSPTDSPEGCLPLDMRMPILPLSVLLLALWAGCGREKRFQLPPDLGRGLPPADSLRTILNWLSQQKSYEAETLRFHYMYEYIRTLARQKPDTLPALVQELRSWTQKSPYPLREGMAALGEAVQWWIQGQYDSAQSRAQAALRIFQEKQRSDYEGKTYHLIGLIHYAQGQYAEALEAYQKALAIRERIGDQQGIASSYNNIGNIHYAQGQYVEALEAYLKALTIRERIGDQQGLADCYNNVGNIYNAKGQYAEALEAYQKALAIWEHLKDQQGLATSYNNIGLIHAKQGRYAEALEAFQKALVIYERIDNQDGMATLYNNIGNIHKAQGRYAEASEAFQKALAIYERIDNQDGMATLYNNIGNIHKAQGRYAEALEAFQKALTIQERIGNQEGMATLYNNIGNIHAAQGRYTEALEALQKALTIRERIGNQEGIASCHNNIGTIHAAQGRYTEALEALQKALAIRERINDQEGIALSYDNIGTLYQAQGLYAVARSYFQKALAIAQSLGLQDLLDDIYLNLAQTDSALAASGLTHLWKSAYLHHRLYAAYKDSVLNEASIRKQAQLESQYEYDKKISLLKAQQEKERALAQAQLQRQKTERNALLTILAVVLLALSTMTYYQILLRRKNRLIQEQAHQLELKNAELQSINQALTESNKIIQAQAEELIAKNAELTTLNTELEATNKALSDSYLTIQKQAKELARKNEEILDSIRYAERIQRAILPSEERRHRLLPDSFLIYQPRDIVAGDFYWLEETDQYIFLAVADATGHGVPGAFVSLVCASALNRTVRQEGLDSPAAILTRAKTIVTQVLTQEGTHLRDGMDIALIRLEKNTPARLTYAGANRPLWIISHQKELIEIPPTRQPIGFTDTEKPFEEHEIDLSSRLPAMLYAFTDGFIDQVGGPKGRKLMSKGLREILLEISHRPCPEQEKHLQRFFTAWKGEWPQLDDVTLIGVRLG
jgi:tetratricopeptide (TPR) repeat protein/serine phosphatase RsbU (regulator of sigma subunit)